MLPNVLNPISYATWLTGTPGPLGLFTKMGTVFGYFFTNSDTVKLFPIRMKE